MGHQSTFYITPKDEADLEQRLRERTDLVILHSRSPTASPRMVDTLSFFENGKPWYFLYLARPEDLNAVVMRHVPEQGYWRLQDSPSPVVELLRCRLDGKTLSEGRVYYVDKFLGPDKDWVEKSEAFRKWARMVHTTIKKSLKRRDSKYVDYIGEDAQAWVDAGGQLVTGDGRPVTW
ncbi:hypothetical protein [Polyangium jinanense]|uniref:Uncharacterized protein n=1 Tax=Polyangium jinanense TaxID=2829994 RepID=A0A9X3X0M4_9BACT|nr:hypothetical protein [Polyangium jinanense]MDC3953623.1 hypothetical protein [Polyangium jinanense]MDC3979256.1 hypothetical protein [Polyangium jinanense]